MLACLVLSLSPLPVLSSLRVILLELKSDHATLPKTPQWLPGGLTVPPGLSVDSHFPTLFFAALPLAHLAPPVLPARCPCGRMAAAQRALLWAWGSVPQIPAGHAASTLQPFLGGFLLSKLSLAAPN